MTDIAKPLSQWLIDQLSSGHLQIGRINLTEDGATVTFKRVDAPVQEVEDVTRCMASKMVHHVRTTSTADPSVEVGEALARVGELLNQIRPPSDTTPEMQAVYRQAVVASMVRLEMPLVISTPGRWIAEQIVNYAGEHYPDLKVVILSHWIDLSETNGMADVITSISKYLDDYGDDIKLHISIPVHLAQRTELWLDRGGKRNGSYHLFAV